MNVITNKWMKTKDWSFSLTSCRYCVSCSRVLFSFQLIQTHTFISTLSVLPSVTGIKQSSFINLLWEVAYIIINTSTSDQISFFLCNFKQSNICFNNWLDIDIDTLMLSFDISFDRTLLLALSRSCFENCLIRSLKIWHI